MMDEKREARCKRGRPVDKKKRDQILDVATAMFLKRGFHGTSMDDIAQNASISKLTLYRRFPDKNTLFISVIEGKCKEYIPDKIFDVFDQLLPQEALLKFAKAFLSLLLSDDIIAMHRMMSAEAIQNPDLTKLFYETGPMRTRTLLGQKMAQLYHKERIKNIHDPEEARDLFLSLFTGSNLCFRVILNVGPKPTNTEIETYCIKAVQFFLKGSALGRF